MKKYTVRQTVNNKTLDIICNRYEMCGWKEVKIVKIFSLINLLGGIAAILLVYFGNLK